MTTWVLNAAALFLTMAGALLMYLYLRGAPRLAENASVRRRSDLTPGRRRHS